MNCKDCRWWQGVGVDWPDGFKRCESPKIVDISERETDVPADGAAFSDIEGYGADFLTGPEFGCIHFEAKASQ